MKTAGILGGMGPGTTADFYLDVNRLAEGRGEAERPEMVILNVPLNYQIEQELLTNETGLEKYLPYLIASARKLEKAGSDFLAIPCNTVHELYDQVAESVDVPILHIVDETVKSLKRNNTASAAVLATGQTVSSGMYQDFMDQAGIECLIPDAEDQNRLNILVSKLVTAEGLEGEALGEEAVWVRRRVNEYLSGVGTVILGCTDFHIVLPDYDASKVVDSMQILAEATVDRIYS